MTFVWQNLTPKWPNEPPFIDFSEIIDLLNQTTPYKPNTT